MKKEILALGLMSGTSADGISIAAVKIGKNRLKVTACETYAYAPEVRSGILSAKSLRAPALSKLNFELGRLYAASVSRFCLKNKIAYSDITVIGSHGQTILHSPRGRHSNTLQLGEASFLAELTGVPVVADFRPRDMAAGGQGAPLVPFADEFLFGSGPARVLLNIGGIANISVTGRGIKTFGFDTGPGNCLMDSFVQELTGGRSGFDKNGRLARAGKIDFEKVLRFANLPYFMRRPPKSLDRDEFGPGFLKHHWPGYRREKPENVLATLNCFTALSISVAVARFAGAAKPSEIVVSGGGALNPVLMANLRDLASPLKISSCETYGLHPLAKEPACFALMAWFALKGKPNHCPSATGASGKRILGKIIPALSRPPRGGG